MARLSVNIDHVATVRQARGGAEPDPIAAALIAELAGAIGITAHLREDRRHIQDRDLELLRLVLKTRLNMEMALTDEMLEIAARIKPEICTPVPEKREELTTEGGLEVVSRAQHVQRCIEQLHRAGILVSLLIDPDEKQVRAAASCGSDEIEIHTGRYCAARGREVIARELDQIKRAAALAQELGMRVNAGHGLNYRNVQPVAAIEGMGELNIGHSIIAHSVFVGLERAVKEMIALINAAK
ncbi:MAG: pyridoxine 5'-phosphate synthase [Candidatus Sumerlaeota bacterium]|nr:pyridoxine 5'-phosphate synthase [Candidatus Sumerlaeota bacterium]